MAKLTFFGYNAFIIQDGNVTICIDPGRNLKWNKLNSLIPKQYWKDIDIILITHEHDDHADFAISVAKASGACLICHSKLVKHFRRKLPSNKIIGLLPTEHLYLKDTKITINTFQTIHGKLRWSILGRQFSIQPKCNSLGYRFTINNHNYFNFGDTAFVDEWDKEFKPVKNAVVMVPCGKQLTMGPEDAARVVRLLKPEYVIPCHFKWYILFYKPTVDDQILCKVSKEIKARYHNLQYGETLVLELD